MPSNLDSIPSPKKLFESTVIANQQMECLINCPRPFRLLGHRFEWTPQRNYTCSVCFRYCNSLYGCSLCNLRCCQGEEVTTICRMSYYPAHSNHLYSPDPIPPEDLHILTPKQFPANSRCRRIVHCNHCGELIRYWHGNQNDFLTCNLTMGGCGRDYHRVCKELLGVCSARIQEREARGN